MNTQNYCIHCDAPISWSVGQNGKSVPVNSDNTPHLCLTPAPEKEPQTEPVITTPAPVVVPSGVMHPAITTSETVIRTISERPDSLEIGTPGKGGALKVYFDSGDLVDAEQRIRNALAIRDLANRISSGGPATLAERMSA